VTTSTRHPAPLPPEVSPRPAPTDLAAAGGAVGLLALAAASGAILYLAGRPVHASSAPLFAHWLPHVGSGTPVVLAVAVLVVYQGERVAATLAWRRLLALGYVTSVAWILALALVDGWQRGFAGRLSTKDEYLIEVAGVHDVPAMLRGFAGRILDFQPDSWTTHVSGHPPGALLVFVGLDRIGIGGGAWASTVCVLVGALVAVAVPVTVRALGDETSARAVIPFVVLLPGTVWIGVSADGLFAGVTATGLALLAIALTRRNPPLGLTAGAVLASGIYLSYGLTLIAMPALAVLVLARRRPDRVLVAVAVGVAAVVVAFTAAGFWWVDGYHLVVQRYYQGIAGHRPYAYWVWADLAAVVVCAGPAAAVILRRAIAATVPIIRRPCTGIPPTPAVVLPLAAVSAILAADLSGLSKAEVERIWLPFVVWLTAGAALLPPPTRRFWLIVQAATALLVNHLLLTTW
jgi:hypothetical protein